VFRGATNLNLDSKGRIAMPARYRDRLMETCGGKLVVTVDRDGCLLIYPLPEWEVIERELAKLPSFDRQARALQRLLIGYATDAPLDGQGRITLPTPLRDFAGLDKKVVLLGQSNKFEVWDEKRWLDQRERWAAGEAEESEAMLPAALTSLSL
jgi:MraZ protein